MSIPLYPKCWRGRTDCEPVHCIDAVPEGTSEEDFFNMEYQPKSFVCSGFVQDKDDLPQDCFRLCFKNEVTDEISDNDVQDMTHILAVISHALAVAATRQVNGGTVEVPTEQGKDSPPWDE